MMPHLHLDYSANLEGEIDISALCQALRQAATEIEAFPLAGVRVRAIRVDHYAIADGNPAHGFIDLSVRLRAGRPPEVKKAAIETLFDAMKSFVGPAMQTRSIALSTEIRDIDADLSPKFGNIREHLEVGS